MEKKEKSKLSKEELIVIIVFASILLTVIAIYSLIIIIYGQKPAEEVPYWVRLILNTIKIEEVLK